MTYEECCMFARKHCDSGWIFNTNTDRGFVYLISGYTHYCSIGYTPVVRVDRTVNIVPMFTGVVIGEGE